VGAVVRSDGFGYVPGPEGIRKVPQVGTVVLEDDVEIGANATIDRAALGTTRIGRRTKIDNLVMIAHGCVVGPYSLIAAQTARGRHRGGHRRATRRAGRIGRTPDDRRWRARRGRSGISSDLAPGGIYGGSPAIDIILWRGAAHQANERALPARPPLEGRAGVDAGRG
jgi:UDP-3-O-[3-hydroxymyristoyl] glucosamine N-acyltransferase